MIINIDHKDYECVSAQVSYISDGTKNIDISFNHGTLDELVQDFINKKNIEIIVEEDRYYPYSFLNAFKHYGDTAYGSMIRVLFSNNIG